MKFIVADVKYDGPVPVDKYGLLLGVTGELQLWLTSNICLLREPLFPIVELSIALHRWRKALLNGKPSDFDFRSLESDMPSLLWFRATGSDRWTVGSPLSDSSMEGGETTDDLLAASAGFTDSTWLWVRGHLGVDVEEVISP